MSDAANVRSIDAIRRFHAAVAVFQEEARLCLSSIELQLLKFMGWLERDRPGFWKREIESCYREIGEARVRLHQCQMRKYADHKPTCFEEKKALEKAKKDLEFAQKQIPVVKYWNVAVQHEANEYHGRSSQLSQLVEREIPRLLALLAEAVDRLEAYGNVQLPEHAVSVREFLHAEDGQSAEENVTSENGKSESEPKEPIDPSTPSDSGDFRNHTNDLSDTAESDRLP
ncbi:MAG: hypothetical protein KDA89_04055 [Planctomycetaceae bacterium]|nr:hypothetical protein [Planctomycetaceae bacterium]